MRVFHLLLPRLAHRNSAAIVLALAALAVTLPVRAEFSFVAIGDTAYNGARDYPLYEQLIDRINSRAPEFTIHVGDLWGAGSCGDEEMDRAAEFFARYDHPLVYTPGDNEWTDCWVEGLGRFDPLERLLRVPQCVLFGQLKPERARRQIVTASAGLRVASAALATAAFSGAHNSTAGAALPSNTIMLSCDSQRPCSWRMDSSR